MTPLTNRPVSEARDYSLAGSTVKYLLVWHCHTNKILCLLTVVIMCLPSCSWLSIRNQSTWGQQIGTFCIEGIPASAKRITKTSNSNGIPVESFEVSLTKFQATHLASPPVLRLFKSTPEATSPLATCKQLQGDLLLEGEIRVLKLRGSQTSPVGVNGGMIEIQPGNLEVELARAKYSLSPLYGGTLELGQTANVQVKVKNSETIVASTGNVATGSIDIAADSPRLLNAKLQLPGSQRHVDLDFVSNQRDVIFRVTTNGLSTELFQGKLIAEQVYLEAPTLVLPGIVHDTFKGMAQKVVLSADKGENAVILEAIDYSFSKSSLGVRKALTTSADGKGAIRTIESDVSHNGNAIYLVGPIIRDLHVSERLCDFSFGSISVADSQDCEVDVPDDAARSLLFKTSTLKRLKVAERILIARFGVASFRAAVDHGEETLIGEIERAELYVGAFSFSPNKLVLSSLSDHAGNLVIHFKIELPTAQGTWKVQLPTGVVEVAGDLERLFVKGTITVNQADPNAWLLHVKEGDLSFGGKVTATAPSTLLGGKPNFGAIALAFSSRSDIQVTASRSSGVIFAHAQMLSILDPQITLGQVDGGWIIKAPTAFDGAVGVSYDIASGRGSLESGHLLLLNIALIAQDKGKLSHVGDVSLTNAAAQIAKLEASLKDGRGSVVVDDFSVTASHAESRPGQDKPLANQIRWSGDLSQPITIRRVSGTIEPNPISRNLRVVNIELSELKLIIHRALYGNAPALTASVETLELNANHWSDTDVSATFKMKAGHFISATDESMSQVTIKEFNLQIASGTPQKPNGTGRLVSENLSVALNKGIEIKESCDGLTDYQKVPVRLDITAGPIDMDLILNEGQLLGKAKVMVTTGHLKNTAEYNCKLTIISWLIQKEVRATYPYPCPTWSQPARICEGWTTIVPEIRVEFERRIKLRTLSASGFIQSLTYKIEPSLDGSTQTTTCAMGIAVAPEVDIVYTIIPLTSIAILNDIINEIEATIARPIENTIAKIFLGIISLLSLFFSSVQICT